MSCEISIRLPSDFRKLLDKAKLNSLWRRDDFLLQGGGGLWIDIVESNNQIRQIYSIADGLMNVTSATSAGTSGSFRIDWYSPNAVLSSGTTGYVTSAGANPVKSFLFSGTYQPALNGRDLRFHLTESRYGGTQTYYTGWEYSEDYDSYCSAMNYQGWAMYKGSASNAILKDLSVNMDRYRILMLQTA